MIDKPQRVNIFRKLALEREAKAAARRASRIAAGLPPEEPLQPLNPDHVETFRSMRRKGETL
jgi:hypothetical protein